MYIAYLENLIGFESVTPNSAGAVEYLENLLKQHGFETELKIFGSSVDSQTTNLYAVYGRGKPNICFVGHVDVVPPGDPALWRASPFTAHIHDGQIYGRGVVDMKGAIACFLAASLDFITNNPNHCGSISFLITSDEEGKAEHGTQEMLQHIYNKNRQIDFAIVGEPTCEEEIGDTIKIGRRGSVNFKLSIEGVKGHVAYPHKANNPLPCLVKIIDELIHTKLDSGTEFFQSSNLEITSIDVGNNASNVIPDKALACFNIRFNNLYTAESLTKLIEEKIKAYCEQYRLNYTLESHSSAQSFIQTLDNRIIEFAKVVEATLGMEPKFSTSGGTSDARFVKNYCPLVEFGLLSATAHKINECAKITNLQKLYDVYYASLIKFLT